jgi:hypothetical protein
VEYQCGFEALCIQSAVESVCLLLPPRPKPNAYDAIGNRQCAMMLALLPTSAITSLSFYFIVPSVKAESRRFKTIVTTFICTFFKQLINTIDTNQLRRFHPIPGISHK